MKGIRIYQPTSKSAPLADFIDGLDPRLREKILLRLYFLTQLEKPEMKEPHFKRFSIERYGWLHITINTLLPHCRYQSPNWLSDTIRRLLDSYEACGKELPFFERAMLIIDEHTAMEGRHIFDQDNKGWKAVSNAIKGRLIPDDDQHTLAVALLSTAVQSQECCHITVLPLSDAHDFFSAHSSDYALGNFYFGGWC